MAIKINQIASKPQLIKVVLDDEQTKEELGDELEFWTWDRQPLDKFMKLASIKQDNPEEIINVVKELILDEDANIVIKDDIMLPTQILIRVIQKVVEVLGK
jgi:hypothetical protein